jgi:alkanesulfonate monooxygenase SsuD/methylene tetrahydromethanopterin reductase-like flavin-dependent oxidoreductase (luciferase family)
VGWCVGLLRDGARRSGRDPKAIGVMVAAPAHVGPRDKVRDRVRWFPALVSNHVVDLVKRYGEKGLPADLTAYVRNRPGYDYQHHAESGSSNAAFVDDESVDRFCVTGEVEEHIEKLRQLAAIGVRQFNVYLMSGDEERILEAYGERIIPALARVPAASSA